MLKEYNDNANYYTSKHNLLFLNIPKVASSTLWSIAAELQNGKGASQRDDVRKYKLPMIRSSRIHEYSDVTKIAFVRNPFDRLVSAYKNKIETEDTLFLKKNKLNKKLTFEEFIHFVCSKNDDISNKHFRSQYTFLFDHQAQLSVDFLGRLETFQKDIQQIIKKYQLPKVDIPHWNKTSKTNYKSYFTKELQAKVEQRYELDLFLLEYSFENGLNENRLEKWKNPLTKEQKIQVLTYKSSRLLKVLHYKEKYDDLPKGIRGYILRRYHHYFTNYFDED